MWPFKPSTVTIAQSGLLEGATDWHSHLLPGVDDGISKLEETIETLKLMGSAGVARVFLTPHIMEDVPNRPADLTERFEKLKIDLADTPYIPSLELGAENMLDTLFSDRLGNRELLSVTLRTVGRADTLLVETSFINPPMGFHALLDDIRSAGFFPLLAHPERYLYMDLDEYDQLKHKDILFQLNLPSLTGFYGPMVKERAVRLLRRGMYDVAGSDTHSLKWFRRMLDAPIRRDLVPLVDTLLHT